jgi:hypothetical protein
MPVIVIDVYQATVNGNYSYSDPTGSVQVIPIKDISGGLLQGFDVILQKQCSLQLLNNDYPISMRFLGVATGSTLYQCSFNRDVLINPSGIFAIYMDGCTFDVDLVESNSSNCKFIGTNNVDVYMSNCTFKYYGSICLSTYPNVNLVNNGNNQIILTSVPPSGLGAIVEPRNRIGVFGVHLLPEKSPYYLGALADNFNFVLDGPVVVQNTLFSAKSSFAQQANLLTFDACTFNVNFDGSANNSECATDGNLLFINRTLIRPSPVLFNNGLIWTFASPSNQVTIPTPTSLIIELTSGNYPDFSSVNDQLQNGVSFRLIGGSLVSAYTYTLGSYGFPITYPINVLMDSNSYAGSFNLQYYSNQSVGLNNLTTAPLTVASLYDVAPTGNNYLYALKNNGASDPSNNRVISLAATSYFFNNGYNIIDSAFTINSGFAAVAYFIFQNSSTQINLGNENSQILPHLTMNQVSPISMNAPSSLSTTPYFTVVGAATMNSCTIDCSAIRFDASQNMTFNNSNITSSQLTFNMVGRNLDLSGCHLDISYNSSSFGGMFNFDLNSTMTMRRSVVDMHGNLHVLSTAQAGSSFTNCVVRVADLSNNELTINRVINSVQNPFDAATTTTTMNQSAVTLKLASPFALIDPITLAADPSFATVTVNVDVLGTNQLQTNNAITLTTNFLRYTPQTYDLSGNVNNIIVNSSNADKPNIIFDNIEFWYHNLTNFGSFLKGDVNGCPFVSFSNNCQFYVEPGLYTIDSVVGANLLSYQPPQGQNLLSFAPTQAQIILHSSGTYNLDNDPLVVADPSGTIYIYYDTGVFSRTVNRASFLTIRVPSDATGLRNAQANLIVNCKSLQVSDQLADLSSNHVLYFNNSTIDGSGSSYNQAIVYQSTADCSGSITFNNSAIRTSSNANNGIIIESASPLSQMTLTGTTTITNNANVQSLIKLLDSSDVINSTRKLNINTLVSYSGAGSMTYFIHNESTMILNINSAPSSGIVNQQVYWPKLYTMVDASGVIASITPLTGNGAVAFAEGWDITNSVALRNYLGNTVDGVKRYGVFVDNSGSLGPYISVDGNDNVSSMIYVEVANKSGADPSVSRTLNKTYTNTTTSHTGKISNNGSGPFVDTNTLTFTNGWIKSNLNFSNGAGSSRVVMMPSNTNNITLALVNNTSSANKSYTNMYTIAQDPTIDNGVSRIYSNPQDYLTNNFFRRYNGTILDFAEPIVATNKNATFVDANFNNNQLNTKFYYIYTYTVTPIVGSSFSFLNNTTVDISWNVKNFNFNGVENPAGSTTSVTMHGIDTAQADSDQVTFSLNYIDTNWVNPTPFNSTLNDTLYTGVTNQPFGLNVYNDVPENSVWINNMDTSYNLPIPTDASNNVPPNYAILKTGDIWNINNISFAQVDASWNPVTGERMYYGVNYVSVIIFQGDGVQPPSTANIHLDLSGVPVIGTQGIDTNQRGSVVFQRIDASGNVVGDNTVPNYNALYRYKVLTYLYNFMDQSALANLSVNYSVTSYDASNIPPLGASTFTMQSINIPLYIDIHANQNSTSGNPWQKWNSTTSYVGSAVRNTNFSVWAVFSGRIATGNTYQFAPKFINDASNNINITALINSYLAPDSNSIDASRNVWTYTQSWNIPENLIVGDFAFDTQLDASNTAIPIAYTANKNSILQYSDSGLTQTVSLVIGKALDLNSNYETTNNTINLNAADNYKGHFSATNANIQPSFSNLVTDASGSLFPFNKFTKFFIAFNTNSIGTAIDASGNLSLNGSASENLALSFYDENNNLITDISAQIDVSGNVPYIYDSSNNSTFKYVDPSGVTWQYIFISRVNSKTQYLETSYKQLKIYGRFTNNSNTPSNYFHLNQKGEVLLGVVDFSNVGLTSVNMSQVFLGNWRIMPSGDGNSLLFRYVQDGSNPYTVSMSMDGSQISYGSNANVNNILPHVSVPLQTDGNVYPRLPPL